jgi:predicted Zn-dependent protease with MMP-like domain
MTMREFKELVRQVMTTLPPEIAAHTRNLVVDVAEEPDDELLHKAGFTDEEIEAGESLYGLFEPMHLPSYEGIETGDRPDRLWVFKAPHEDDFPDPRQLRTEIRKTVIHELAHHFGFDENDLEKWDANPDPFRE